MAKKQNAKAALVAATDQFEKTIDDINRGLWRRVGRQVLQIAAACKSSGSREDKIAAMMLVFHLRNARRWVREDGPKGLMLAATICDMLSRATQAMNRHNGVAERLKEAELQRERRRAGGKSAASIQQAAAEKRRDEAIGLYQEQRANGVKYEVAVERVADILGVNGRTIERYISARRTGNS